jgi:transcription termination factor Rho
MSETAEPSLLAEGETLKKTPRRRTTTASAASPTAAKTRKKATAVVAEEEATAKVAEASPDAPTEVKAKTRTRKAAAPKAATVPKKVPAAPAEEPAPAPAPAPVVKAAKAAASPKKGRVSRKKAAEELTGELPLGGMSSKKTAARVEEQKIAAKVVSDGVAAEEWSPSKRAGKSPAPVEEEKAPESVAAAKSEPSPTAAPAAPEDSPAPAPSPVAAPVIASDGTPIAAPPPPGRKYPVYIPRHVAKQMEAEGQTDPSAIAAAAAAAAQAASAPEFSRREPHQHRQPAEPRPEPPPPKDEEIGTGEGMVEISGKGFGFIRDLKRGFAQHPSDIFVTPETVKRYNLRDGQWIKGETRRGGRGSQLYKITEINGDEPEKARTLPAFDELTVINPMERFRLETTPDRYTTRVMDLMTPVGKGQRGLIVAPPRTGKTTLLQHIADAVVKNHPDVKLIMLLVDERPEEVTEIKRTVPTAELMASSNDMDVKSHTRIAQLAIERAKRLVESGRDVFVLLDSITRVGRAFNNAMAGGGRTMSGGVDARALEIPRKLFAAARNTEEAGSLTIIATALIETGSRMDDLIFQEFKGTGNMELVLDRKIADQRIYPAVDIFLSGTRREELLVPADDLHKIALIRRGLAGHKPMEAIERLLFFAKKFPTNAQMLREIPG